MPTEGFMSKIKLLLFFDFIDAMLKIRKLSCSFQKKGNYFLKILSNLDISAICLCMRRKQVFTSYTQRAPQTHAAAVVLNQNCLCAEMLALRVPEFKLTGNLNESGLRENSPYGPNLEGATTNVDTIKVEQIYNFCTVVSIKAAILCTCYSKQHGSAGHVQSSYSSFNPRFLCFMFYFHSFTHCVCVFQ
jgi:hypothetical protein